MALDALFVQSTVHGLARFLQSRAPQSLDLPTGIAGLASGRDRGQIRIWSNITYDVLGVIERPRDAVRSMLFDTQGNQLLISAGDSTVRVWDIAETVGY